MKKILMNLLAITLSTLWLFNFLAGIIGAIWLVAIGGGSLVLLGIIADFLMPIGFMIGMIPVVIFAPLISKAVDKDYRFIVSVFGLIMAGFNNFLLSAWAVLIFSNLFLNNLNLPFVALWLWGYAVVMSPVGYMAKGEGPEAGTGTSFGVLFVQISYILLTLSFALFKNESITYQLQWLLLLVYTIIGVSIGLTPYLKKNKADNDVPLDNVNAPDPDDKPGVLTKEENTLNLDVDDEGCILPTIRNKDIFDEIKAKFNNDQMKVFNTYKKQFSLYAMSTTADPRKKEVYYLSEEGAIKGNYRAALINLLDKKYLKAKKTKSKKNGDVDK